MILIKNLNKIVSVIHAQVFGTIEIALNDDSVSLSRHQNFEKRQSTCSSSCFISDVLTLHSIHSWAEHLELIIFEVSEITVLIKNCSHWFWLHFNNRLTLLLYQYSLEG